MIIVETNIIVLSREQESGREGMSGRRRTKEERMENRDKQTQCLALPQFTAKYNHSRLSCGRHI